MAHAQKTDFVFRRNGRVHLNRQGRQFSRVLAAEACTSPLVMLDTPPSEVVWEYWLPTPFASFPFTSPPVRHRVPSGFKRPLPVLPRWLISLSLPNEHLITFRVQLVKMWADSSNNFQCLFIFYCLFLNLHFPTSSCSLYIISSAYHMSLT